MSTVRLLATSGRGPAECRIALAKALDVLAHEAGKASLDCDIAPGDTPDRHGAASAIVLLEGDGADVFARRWLGSILWVATSPVRPHHKRKNWFIGIFALPAPAKAPASIQLSDIRFEAMRAGGPGGQHQNKTESAVRAIHRPTGLSVVARDGRSQHRNKAIAIERLATMLHFRAELARSGEKALIQQGHDNLERGNPTRRFHGPEFRPD